MILGISFENLCCREEVHWCPWPSEYPFTLLWREVRHESRKDDESDDCCNKDAKKNVLLVVVFLEFFLQFFFFKLCHFYTDKVVQIIKLMKEAQSTLLFVVSPAGSCSCLLEDYAPLQMAWSLRVDCSVAFCQHSLTEVARRNLGIPVGSYDVVVTAVGCRLSFVKVETHQ